MPTHKALPQFGERWIEGNRFAVIRARANIADCSAGHVRTDAANHRFHFGELWQPRSPSEKTPNAARLLIVFDSQRPTPVTVQIILAANRIVWIKIVRTVLNRQNSRNLLDADAPVDDPNSIQGCVMS